VTRAASTPEGPALAVVDGVEVPGAAVRAFFGPAWPAVEAFAELLSGPGVERGLVGPREAARVWSRHLINSAALAEFLPAEGAVIDVGSGAGLPGLVLAAMRPDLEVHLVEPMQRRVAWLREVRDRLALDRVIVHPARAEELHGALRADVVTARAVAPLDRLVRWTVPLVRRGGRLAVLKGRRAAEELRAAEVDLRRAGAVELHVHEVDVLHLGDPTFVVEVLLGDRPAAAFPRRPRRGGGWSDRR
jgi:16S rRNA (guanine527-N7)-methyltransferase